jgi:hypothetical protein
MQNPRSRVQELRLEIDRIGKKIALSSNIVESPNNAEGFNKKREKEDLQKKLESLKSSTKQKKETLQSDLKKIFKKLNTLVQQKQNVAKNKVFRSKYQQQVQSLELDLKKVFEEFKTYTETLSRRQKGKYNANLANKIAFEEALKPIELELNSVTFQHRSLLEHLNSLELEAERLENIAFMTKEDIFSACVARAELILEREGLEAEIEIMEFEYPDELEYDQKEDEFILSMLKVKNLKDPYIEQLKSLENSLKALEFNLPLARQSLESINTEYLSMCTASPGFEELRNVEEMIKDKCRTYNTDYIDSIIVDVNALEGFNIDEEILKIQLKHIDSHEAWTRKLWEAEQTELQDTLKLLSLEKKSIFETQQKLNHKKSVYRNKIAAIHLWKSYVNNAISDTDNLSKIASDTLVSHEFKSQFSSINYKEHKKLEGLINIYIALLEKRENFYSGLPFSSKLKQKTAASNKIWGYCIEKPMICVKQITLKIELLNITDHENTLMESVKELGLVPNPIKAQLYLLKQNLENWEKSYTNRSDKIQENKKLLNESLNALELINNEIKTIKLNTKQLSTEEYNLSSQVEEILQRKRADMLSSLEELQKNTKNPEEKKVYELKYKVLEASIKLEKASRELNEFDLNVQGISSNIEQEESDLKQKQQEIELSLKELESEMAFIKENEEKIKKLDQIESPLFSIDQCRSPLEEFYRNEIKDSDDIGMLEGSYLEFVEKSLGKQVPSTRINPRTLNKKYYRFKLENIGQSERSFYEKIMPLLEGAELYKKSTKTEKKIAFSPLEDSSPEVCGYAIRYFRLHKSLEKIEAKQPLKPGFDLRIKVDQIISPKISKVTLSILNAQGHLGTEELDYDKPYEANKTLLLLPVSKTRESLYYPLSIALSTKEKVQIIAKDYITFKQWVNGINALVKNKKKLHKLSTRIESYTSV